MWKRMKWNEDGGHWLPLSLHFYYPKIDFRIFLFAACKKRIKSAGYMVAKIDIFSQNIMGLKHKTDRPTVEN